jgi:hypothetical protein
LSFVYELNTSIEASFMWLIVCVLILTTQVRFVIMGNLFCSDHTIHRRFDLKGSSLGRITDKPLAEIDEYTTLKDLDLNFTFRLQKQWYQEFQRCEHLIPDSHIIMTYVWSVTLLLLPLC